MALGSELPSKGRDDLLATPEAGLSRNWRNAHRERLMGGLRALQVPSLGFLPCSVCNLIANALVKVGDRQATADRHGPDSAAGDHAVGSRRVVSGCHHGRGPSV